MLKNVGSFWLITIISPSGWPLGPCNHGIPLITPSMDYGDGFHHSEGIDVPGRQ